MLNQNLGKLNQDLSFSELNRRVKKYRENNPEADLISLGIGDVSKAIIEPVAKSMISAVKELSKMESFKGYGAYFGYDFLKEAILKNEYQDHSFTNEEIYISNGTKTDVSNILELFDINSKILTTNPGYSVYADAALVLNRKIDYLNLSEETNFLAIPPKEKYDLIYLCSPNNPLGIAYDKDTLERWIDYALKNKAVILYDNVYSDFIRSSEIPRSIYEIKNAKKVAIEFRSFSKTASFTGVRCSYYIISNEIADGINDLWKERTISRFNGTDYVAQKGAAATYELESQKLIKDNINDYLDNAKILKKAFLDLGYKVWGGDDSPYLWVKINGDDWDFFDKYLNEYQVIIVPGSIFGSEGRGYIRLSALAKKEDIKRAISRIKA